MCVMSMVYDHYQPLFPQAPSTTTWITSPSLPSDGLAELRQLIKDFREAVAAAKKVDDLTNQKDCVDPAKAKLDERVAALEKRIGGLELAAGIADAKAGRVSKVPRKVTRK